MATYLLKETPTDDLCVWIDLQRGDQFTTIGMIKQVKDGFISIGALTEEKFTTYKEARKYLLGQWND